MSDNLFVSEFLLCASTLCVAFKGIHPETMRDFSPEVNVPVGRKLYQVSTIAAIAYQFIENGWASFPVSVIKHCDKSQLGQRICFVVEGAVHHGGDVQAAESPSW